jgi:hypothetical protein
MTTITGSGTLTYSSGLFSYGGTYTGDINTWPITINASLTVTFGSDLTLTTTAQYFIIGGENVTIDGAGYQVDYSEITGSYYGFIDGGSYNYSTVQNIACIRSGANLIYSYISKGNFTASSSISNCYVICGGNINSGGIAAQYNSAPISNCYVICAGDISFSFGSGGIAGQYNTGTITNCYVICGGNLSGGGIAGYYNSGTISNCYFICGGDISGTGSYGGGIAAYSNSVSISNCYVICGKTITGSNAGGIAANNNTGTISNCYVNYYAITKPNNAITPSTSGTTVKCKSLQSNPAKWTSIGSAYLTSSTWTNTDSTNQTPWLLSAFDTAIASSTTATSTSGSIALNTYGQSFSNGTVYSGKQSATFTYNVGSSIAYSSISSGTTYTLGLYAYQLLSELTSSTFTFTFTYDAQILSAYNSTDTTANNIVPYEYSVTDDVTLSPATSSTNYYSSTSGSDLINVFELYTSGTKTTTNYKVNGQDLSDIFQPYSSGTKAETTGITVNGSDLNNIFKIKNI